MNKDNTKSVAGPTLALQRCPNYHPEAVDAQLGRLLEQLGGLSSLVSGKEVLLKPNFLVARPVERGIVTHPQVIRAMARAVLEAGARKVVVSDSPAVGKARRVAKRIGLLPLLDPLGVEVVEMGQKVELARPDPSLPALQVARLVLESELVINLAKLKTHSLCGMTMAVKNCFGAVVGLGKARWHVRTGRDVVAFGRMLVDVCRALGPALSLVDGIQAMDGEGPNAGRVRPLGFLAACSDPFVLDRVLASMCGAPEEWVATFGPDGKPDLSGVTYPGLRPEELAVSDWLMPKRFGKGKMPWPRFSHRRCDGCQQCVQVCQSHALELRADKIRLDKKSCIHCFCCHEVCPQQAISLGRRWFGM